YIIKYITPLFLLAVFIFSLPGIWNKILNTDIKEKLSAATDPAVIQNLQTQMRYVNFSRLLLLALFIGISYMVYVAYKKRIKEGRFTS
ncbi:hypothetical protein, partial [Escherichia coli]|uniref:hypothetical protein n=1 Tax=Escherichia coli TaxID=562 RepID=UPI0019D5D435